MKKAPYLFAVAACLLLAACFGNAGKKDTASATVEYSPIEKAILQDSSSFYYVNFDGYNANDAALPIGVFDSGTGGLTVLDALVNFDENNNISRDAGKDSDPDFAKEKFIYLADQANMPYGNYFATGKTDLLVEHIVKDAQFLLAAKYYANAVAKQCKADKDKVKAIVIACNTATAYGKKSIEEFLEKTGVNIPVIGVIDAGVKGALETFAKDENGSIGVFATVGTIGSKGYENTIVRMKNELGYTGNIQVYNQGGHGVAEVVDGEPDYVDYKASKPRDSYRGPSLTHADYKIEKALLDVYNFNYTNNQMLCDSKKADDCSIMQINSPENYIRYHMVSLFEQMRKAENVQPLKTIIMGCTHYPYLTKELNMVLNELYSYQKDGKYVYRDLMHKEVKLIDPAINVAIELHLYLKNSKLFNTAGSMNSSEFFISVPNTANANVVVDEQGRFTYDYKYGRTAGEIQEYVKVVPFSKTNIPVETISRLRNIIPNTFALITSFSNTSGKAADIPATERISE